MLVAIAAIAVLTAAAIAMLRDSGTHARRVATDRMTGWIDQARTLAINSRCHAVLALAEPGDLPAADAACRIGLFKVEGEWPADPSMPINATLVKRWSPLEKGIVLLDGEVGSLTNPIDGEELTISDRGTSVLVHALVFHPRGVLKFPQGADPVVIRIAEGVYRDGDPVAKRQPENEGIPETILRVGRSIARPYRMQ
jgi:hypothetical protein